MKQHLGALALVALVGNTHAAMVVIDDFSSNTSGTNYNTVLQWSGGGTGTGAASYACNASNQFQPTGGNSQASTVWLRKDAYVFAVGDTISIDVMSGGAAGLVWSTLSNNVANSGSDNWGVALLDNGQYGNSHNFVVEQAGSAQYNQTQPDLALPLTIKVTRTVGGLDYEFAYTNTSGGASSVSGSIGGLGSGTYYFGMLGNPQFTPGSVIMDNLSHSVVPEPAALGLLVLGGLTLFRRRR